MQIHKIKYVITPSRFNDNDYLELTDISELADKLSEIGRFIESKSELLPPPLKCNITRIDVTKNLYAGDDLCDILNFLQKCYMPCSYDDCYKEYDNNATFTKKSISRDEENNNKIFEISFYDKYAEMCSHIKKHGYNYSEDDLEKAKGILRLEFRFYSPRLKNIKKALKYKTAEEFLQIFSLNIDKIIRKNLRSLYMSGNFYKLCDIKDMIAFSSFKRKTKQLMDKFITLSAKHKNSNKAAIYFVAEHGEDKLKQILRNFNKLDIIPVPIPVRTNLDEWGFME